ncbi:MAG: c-type cytochrome [Candidatus Marinimicrobia bacterium]|nr:c-type cytochrome [Candidatus Neomarinimicrobiota bacterium]MCF7829310.1 c-type cytochrome [Candidatus Neomarinimicrobiota bacterium]MCF7880028.1 c-type cytochrome [Candidatus Neomarinimicrobiota bacterium]
MNRGFYLLNSLIFAIILCLPFDASAQQSVKEFFRQNCYSCHTIGGGRLTGPDLKNVSERQDREWLVEFILNPKQVLNSGDPYAVKLQKEARGAVMTDVPGIDRQLANALLDFIAEESQKEESEFAGSQISDRPLTPADVAQGRKIFFGTQNLQNGGPSCISCHTVNDQDYLLGGGTLGPNLTGAFGRLQGRKGLSSWLTAPPSVTMQPVYKNQPIASDEVLPLVAFLQNQQQQKAQARMSPFINLLLFGVGGAALLLVIFDQIWGFRFRGVRKSLLRKAKKSRQD